jgi:lysozyme family protein
MFNGLKNLIVEKKTEEPKETEIQPQIPQETKPQEPAIAEPSSESQTVAASEVGNLADILSETPPPAPKISKLIRFREIVRDIFQRWSTCIIEPLAMMEVRTVSAKLLQFRHKYETIERKCGVPWYLVGVLHYRESSFSFERNLCNGEDLDHITTMVPKGRGPYHTWEESAIDALMLQNLHLIPHWSIERVIFEAERYNGFGYRKRGLESPYVWAYSNYHDGRGIYDTDGHFNPDKKTSQLGIAVVLVYLTTLGAINPNYEGR